MDAALDTLRELIGLGRDIADVNASVDGGVKTVRIELG
jgi:hypothetical protein